MTTTTEKAGTPGRVRQFWLDLPLRTKGLVILAIPLVALLAGPILSWRAVAAERSAKMQAIHSLETKISLQEAENLVLSAETGGRGMTLTQNREFLEPYKSALARWPVAFTSLKKALAVYPEGLAAVEQLGSLVDARFRVVDQLLETAPGADPDGALLAEGNRLTNQIRSVVERLDTDVDALLTADRSRMQAARRLTQTRLLAVAGLGGALGIGAMVLFAGGMATRLSDLMRSSASLERAEAMPPLPTAADEVGQLSSRLVAASSLLQTQQREITRTRHELDQFFSLSPDMLSIIAADGTFKRINPAWEETLGLTGADIVGAPYMDFVHPDDRVATVAEAQRLAEGARTLNFENRYRTHDGTYRWMSWRVAPNAAADVFYSVTRDVTEPRQRAQELAHRTALLAEANRELEAFAYSVSHDLRAPLRHINGFSKMLEQSSQAWDDIGRGFLRKIQGAATKMSVLIDDLLGFSRMGQTRLAPTAVNLAPLVAAVRDEVVTGLDHPQIEWHVHELPIVIADAAMLRLVFTNLLGNAVKYSRPRTPAVIEVGTMPSDPIEHVVFVRDNGVGFDMTYVDKLFGVFQRLHSADDFEGTGIGLANVRRIVQRHGGRVWAEGVVDAGATFYFSLPRTEATSDAT